MAIDIFETRVMLEALQQTKRPTTFLVDTLFPRADPVADNTVQLDIVKGKRRIAPYVSPLHEGRIVEHEGYTTEHFEPPYLKPKMKTDAEDLLKRQPGEIIFGNRTPQQAAQSRLGRDMGTLDETITRREEQMAADVLADGKVTVKGDGVDRVIDFGLDSTHNLGTDDVTTWGNSSAKPIELLKSGRRTIIQDAGINPDVVIMGSKAVDTFISHSNVQDKLDNRRMNLGTINPQNLPEGVTYYGMIPEIGCDIYSYDAWYVDPATGSETAMIDEKSVHMASTNARANTLYAMIQDVEAGNAAVTRFPKSWVQPDPSARFLMVQSAPLVSMLQPDAFWRATVLT